MSDPHPQSNALLNDLLVQAYRSLLQYTIECWPWTDPDAVGEQETVRQMAEAQQAAVQELASLLDHRHVPIDFGTYPDWSGLHFVSLDYLLSKLIADETNLIARIEQALAALSTDLEAKAALRGLLQTELSNLGKLRELSAARKAAVPA